MSKEITYWTSIVKRFLFVVGIVIGIFGIFKLTIFYMPFLIAFVIAIIMEPLIKILMKKFKFNRKISSIIVFILTFGIIVGLIVWGITTLITESTNLLENVNIYYNKWNEQIQNLINDMKLDNLNLPKEFLNILNNSSLDLLEKFSKWIQNFLSDFLSGLTKIPTIAIYFGVTIISLYFICTDRIYMLDELEHHLPERWVNKLSKHIRDIISVLGGYLKAQISLILISFCICLIGLYILYFMNWDIKFPLLIALGIAFVDALPILGSGTIMIPWGIVTALNGDFKLGIAIVGLWIIMSITRQLIEPKIVSSKIGIHPIFTIIAMYTGFKFIGVIGMFFGPIILIIIKNIFSNFIDKGIFKSILDIK